MLEAPTSTALLDHPFDEPHQTSFSITEPAKPAQANDNDTGNDCSPSAFNRQTGYIK